MALWQMALRQLVAVGLCTLANGAAPPPPPPPPAPAPAPPMPNPGMIFPGDGRHTGGTPSVPAEADCAVRKAAWAYGKKLQPQKGAFRDLFDALQLGNGCGLPPPPPSLGDEWLPPLAAPAPPGERVLFVQPASSRSRSPLTSSSSSAADADDAASSSSRRLAADTFASVEEAVAASRSMPKPLTIALREGTHYLADTIHLGAADSGLTLRNAGGERAVLSGGKPLTPAWKASAACAGCFEASLQGQVTNVPGLRCEKRLFSSLFYI